MKKTTLAFVNPLLMLEWQFDKNELTPDEVAPNSNKKVWWKCKKGHEWQARIAERHSRGRGCPYCAGQKAGKDNSLAALKPEIAKEWHPLLNGDLRPENVTVGSGKKAWWRCAKGHVWQSSILSRKKGHKCPFCSGKRATKDTALATVNLDLALQWHSTKNKNLTPENVLPFSHKKVWWQCKKGHQWKATIASRSNGAGCPYCYQNQFKKQEVKKEKLHLIYNIHIKKLHKTALGL